MISEKVASVALSGCRVTPGERARNEWLLKEARLVKAYPYFVSYTVIRSFTGKQNGKG